MKRFLILLLALLMTGCNPSSPDTPESTTETESASWHNWYGHVIIELTVTMEPLLDKCENRVWEAAAQGDAQRIIDVRKSTETDIEFAKKSRERIAALKPPEEYDELHDRILQWYDDTIKAMEDTLTTSDPKELNQQAKNLLEQDNKIISIMNELREEDKEKK